MVVRFDGRTAGNPVISYYDRTNGDLKVAVCDDPVCGDNTAPTLVGLPDDITGVEATDSDGATVTYTPPTATDTADASPDVACVPVSGSAFPLGTTAVICTATDASDNSSVGTFDVEVLAAELSAAGAPAARWAMTSLLLLVAGMLLLTTSRHHGHRQTPTQPRSHP